MLLLKVVWFKDLSFIDNLNVMKKSNKKSWQGDEAYPVIDERGSKFIDIAGQTPAKALIIRFIFQFHTQVFFVEVGRNELLCSISVLFWNACFCKIFCQIYWRNVFFTVNIFFNQMSFHFYQQPTYFWFSKTRIVVIFVISVKSMPLNWVIG